MKSREHGVTGIMAVVGQKEQVQKKETSFPARKERNNIPLLCNFLHNPCCFASREILQFEEGAHPWRRNSLPLHCRTHHDSRLKLVIVRKRRFTHTDDDQQKSQICEGWSCNPGCSIPSSVFTWWTLQFASHDIDYLLCLAIPRGFRVQSFEMFQPLELGGLIEGGMGWGRIWLQGLLARRLLSDP